jgi:hypothetical protein
MIFRLKVLLPLLLIAGGLYYSFTQVGAPVVEFMLEKQIDGLNVDDLSFDVVGGNVSLETKASYGDERGSLLSVGQSQLKLAYEPLGFGEVVAAGHLENVMVHSRVFDAETYRSEEATADGASEETVSGAEAKKDAGSGGGFSIEDIDHREVLERFTGTRELATEKKIKEAKLTVEALQEKWKKRYEGLKSQADDLKQKGDLWKNDWEKEFKVDDLKQKIESIKSQVEAFKGEKFDVKDLDRLATNIQNIQKLNEDIKGIKAQAQGVLDRGKSELNELKQIRTSLEGLKHSDDELKADIHKLKQLKDEIVASGKSDVEMLKKELDPREFDAAKLTRLLLGREWELKLKIYLDALNGFVEKLPKVQAEGEDDSETSVALLERDRSEVVFERATPRPKWTVESLSYKGFAAKAVDGQDVPFHGVLRSLSSDEKVLGLAPSLELEGQLKGRGGQVHIFAQYSALHDSVDQRFLKFDLSGRSMKDSTMGAPSMRLKFLDGSMAVRATVDLASAPHWVVEGDIRLSDLNFVVADSVKQHMRGPLKEAATKLFAQSLPFSYRYPGPIRFEGNVKNVLGDVFKSALSTLATQEQQKLGEKLQQRFQEKMGERLAGLGIENILGDQIPALTGAVGNSLQHVLKINGEAEQDLSSADQLKGTLEQLLADSLGLKGGREQLTQQLKQRLEDEAKRRLQEMAERELRDRLKKEELAKLKLLAEKEERERLIREEKERLRMAAEQEKARLAELARQEQERLKREALNKLLNKKDDKSQPSVKPKDELNKLKDAFKGFSF